MTLAAASFPCILVRAVSGLFPDSVIRRLLAAREERAWLQEYFLSSFAPGVCCVAQLSLNIPGWPKRLPGDERAIRAAAKIFTDASPGAGPPLAGAFLSNAAGLAILLALRGDPASGIKKTVIGLEEGLKWGRALDIDVITSAGPLSRALEGFPARRCLICGEDAKICARTKAHPIEELRGKVESLLGLVPPSR